MRNPRRPLTLRDVTTYCTDGWDVLAGPRAALLLGREYDECIAQFTGGVCSQTYQCALCATSALRINPAHVSAASTAQVPVVVTITARPGHGQSAQQPPRPRTGWDSTDQVIGSTEVPTCTRILHLHTMRQLDADSGGKKLHSQANHTVCTHAVSECTSLALISMLIKPHVTFIANPHNRSHTGPGTRQETRVRLPKHAHCASTARHLSAVAFAQHDHTYPRPWTPHTCSLYSSMCST